MRPPITHINLLQRSAPVHTVAWSLAAVLVLTVAGLVVYGNRVFSKAQAATHQRDDVALQVKDLQARLAARTGEQTKTVAAQALRKEADILQPRAQVAQALIDAVRQAEGGRTDQFARPLVAMTGLNEPGLWLTTLTVSAGGKRLELQGEANTGASVLRFARKANASLQPLTLHLGSLEMQPAAAVGPAPGAGSRTVSFRLY